MLETIKNFYTNIRRAEARAVDVVKAAAERVAAEKAAVETEVSDARRHIEALSVALLDDEKAKLEAWLEEHNKAS